MKLQVFWDVSPVEWQIFTDAPKDRSVFETTTMFTIRYKSVKFVLQPAMKAQRGSRGIALLFL
jgi:hypothetical protein